MKHIKLFEQFLNEGQILSKPPKSYGDADFWNSTFKGGITDAFVDKPKFRSVIHSIAYDLKLPVWTPRGDVYGLTHYGRNITNAEGDEIIVKDAFTGDMSYEEIRDAVERWVKVNKWWIHGF